MSKKEANRGSKDEVESIKIILDENPYLRARVLEKLRSLKGMYEARTKEKSGSGGKFCYRFSMYITNLSKIRITFVHILSILFLYTTGCISTGSGPQVVERSKESRPSWVDEGGTSSIEIGEKLLFIKEGEKLKDLPLGIKDTQLEALKDSEAALNDMVVNHIDTVSSDAGISVVNKKTMASTISRVVKSSHNRYAKVQDIYFEKIYDQNIKESLEQEYYNIYVKIEYPKPQINMILKRISSKFTNSKYSDLKQVARRLSKLGWKLYSH